MGHGCCGILSLARRHYGRSGEWGEIKLDIGWEADGLGACDMGRTLVFIQTVAGDNDHEEL